MSASRTADVVVVGAGIAGAGLAAALAGRRRVVVLEREAQAGSQATGRSAAVFVPAYGDGPLRALTALGAEALLRPDPALWEQPLLRRRGLLRLAAEEGVEDYEAQLAGAEDVEAISLGAARERFPLLRPERFARASFEADVFDIEVEALLQGCLRAARRGGAELRLGCALRGLAREGSAWRIETGEGSLSAPVVVDAAGAWAEAVAALAGLPPLGLRPLRRSMATLDLPQGTQGSDAWPFVVRFPLTWYAKPDAGRLLVSPGDEAPVEPHDAFADDMTVAEGLHAFEQDTTLTVQRVGRTWAGLRTHAPDGRPVVGFDPSAEGFFWLAGQGGFGVQTAPGLSSLAADLLCGEALDAERAALAAAFRPGRFRQGRDSG
jgi:D-arginine dehydrogenase